MDEVADGMTGPARGVMWWHQADVALVYGLDDTFEESAARWRKAGYRSQVMTGVAWDACYTEPWHDPVSSLAARHRATKLKQYLYTRTPAHLFVDLADWSEEST